jgi:osmoprotectant transport system permease protein
MLKLKQRWLVLSVYALIFVVWVWRFDWIRRSFLFFMQERRDVIQRVTLPELALQHLTIVLWASLFSFLIGFGLALFVHLSRSKEIRSLITQLATLGETLPTVSLLALSVPLLGYGNLPIVVALSVYGVLPILRTTLTGFDQMPSELTEAAESLGISRLSRLWRLEWPQIRPYVLSGMRISTLIHVSAATIGATVGAGGLGVMIVSGIRSYNPILIVQASVPVIVLALWFDQLLRVDT